MMLQHLIVLILFAGAVFYLGSLALRAFTRKGCASGCGKCSAVDFQKLEQKIKNQKAASLP
jgi:hypothetical protein